MMMVRPISEIEADLKKVGNEFKACTGCEYTEMPGGELWNTKDMLGHQIYALYSELGRALKECKN